MARRRKKPTPKEQPNRIRRIEDTPMFTGGSKLPEDEIKKTRRKATNIETGSHKRVARGELEEPRKGRPPKKEPEKKPPKDRHVPRKSELEKEYTKELQKLRNRLRYREKQGYFVRWETLPSKAKNISQYEIDKLKSYVVRLNDLGEIELNRMEYERQAREYNLRVSKENLPNYVPPNEPDFVPPTESTLHFDVFDRIESAFMTTISLVQNEGTQVDHPMNENYWVYLSGLVEEHLHKAFEIYKAQRDTYKEEYASYLERQEAIIVSIIDAYVKVSDEDGLQQVHEELLPYLEMH